MRSLRGCLWLRILTENGEACVNIEPPLMLAMQRARDALGIGDPWILYGKRPRLSVYLRTSCNLRLCC